MKNFVATISGWYGTLAMLLAYILISFDVLSPHSFLYQLMNVTAAISLVYYSTMRKDFPMSVLNVFWAFVAIVATINLF
ncbi:MAG: hypothetical protein COX80_00705 [Candidatus Magasanikbacteria bacterium CG_4_10_14_0_2_um_filter_33_14]|uniref:CBU-0592-like domain-containing protein n=1 Tax=Candidatus Magasanikbacteria bacterium CG_4_10_14_0_2_um_filter_33_14 TaxID=1974636 RepID=A0A2M7VBT4_9BACT|nr:MAG: hypothetical protein COX80_00705 [Candidatus Magasanikbacteria bacterium CG_4_10_14_0_2_um_filter_33_14]